LMAVKATTSAPSRRGVDVSNGVFVSGMYTKDDPVTWEIRVPSARKSGDRPQGKTGAVG
jgi:hypothetical protein